MLRADQMLYLSELSPHNTRRGMIHVRKLRHKRLEGQAPGRKEKNQDLSPLLEEAWLQSPRSEPRHTGLSNASAPSRKQAQCWAQRDPSTHT